MNKLNKLVNKQMKNVFHTFPVFQNIDDIEVIMTKNMKKSLAEYTK